MALTPQVISEFAKMANAKTDKQPNVNVYGTAVISNGKTYVRIDGSTTVTPAVTTSAIKDGDRVTVKIENHTAVIMGNITSPAAREADVKDLADASGDYKVIKKDVDALLVEMTECKNDVDNLQRQDTAHSLAITNIENDIQDHARTITDLEDDVLSIQLTNNTQTKNITSIMEQLTNIAADITDIKSRLEALENQS